MRFKIQFPPESDITVSLSSGDITVDVRTMPPSGLHSAGSDGRLPSRTHPSVRLQELRTASEPLARELLLNEIIGDLVDGRIAVAQLAYQTLLARLHGKGLAPVSWHTFRRRLDAARKVVLPDTPESRTSALLGADRRQQPFDLTHLSLLRTRRSGDDRDE